MKTIHTGLALAVSLLAACSGGSAGDPPALNRAPTVSDIGATDIVANGKSAPIAFTVTDEDPADLAIGASSDRPELVPDDGIAVGGSGRQRSLKITPTVDSTGDALVTLIVTDPQGLAASSAFLLRVNAEQKSLAQFTRSGFSASDGGDPAPINAVEFLQDAGDDDFADLLAQ